MCRKTEFKHECSELQVELISKGDKRNSKIEKIQLDLLKNSLNNICLSRSDIFEINYQSWNTKKKGNKWYISEKGKILEYGDSKKNKVYDSKSFDSIVTINFTNGRCINVYFILKGIQNEGGHQDNVIGEIGMYSKMIKKNKDSKNFFVFILDGEYIQKYKRNIRKSKNYIVVSSNDFEAKFNNILNKINNF